MQIFYKLLRLIDLAISRQINRLINHFQIVATENIKLTRQIKVGRHTYGVTQDTCFIADSMHPPTVTIGNFCSIAPGVIILANADHRTDLPSTYPFRTNLFPTITDHKNATFTNFDVVTHKSIIIGHDVWIGQNVIILGEVLIGTGSVIGAGAVVTKDIPPYAIAVGNPAKIIKYRFSPELVEHLLKSEWWLLSDEQLKKLDPFLYI